MHVRTFLAVCALAAPSLAAEPTGAPLPPPAPAPAREAAGAAVEETAEESLAPAPVPVFAPPSGPRAPLAAPPSRPTPAEPTSAPKAEDVTPERFSFDLASRGLFVRDDAFGVFSSERKVGLGGLAGRATVYREGPWSLAVGAAIEGRKAMSGKVRGAEASVALDRPTLRAEVTYELARYLDAVGTIGLGGEKLAFRYTDPGTTETASADSWKATADVGVGVDAHTRLGPVVVGVRLEGGLLTSGAHALRAALPDVGDVARRPVDLGELATGGAFTRFALRVGY